LAHQAMRLTNLSAKTPTVAVWKLAGKFDSHRARSDTPYPTLRLQLIAGSSNSFDDHEQIFAKRNNLFHKDALPVGTHSTVSGRLLNLGLNAKI
jgi:hypothetical protein